MSNNKVGRPPITADQKQQIFRKLEPYLKSGMSINKACLSSKIPSSTVYDLKSNDQQFSAKIQAAQNYHAVLVNDVLTSQLELIRKSMEENSKLKSSDIKFVQWMATHSRATKKQYSKLDQEINIKGYNEAELEKLAVMHEQYQEIANNPKAISTLLKTYGLLQSKMKNE